MRPGAVDSAHLVPDMQQDLHRLARDWRSDRRDTTWTVTADDIAAWRNQGLAPLLHRQLCTDETMLEAPAVDALARVLARAAEQAVSLESRAAATVRLLDEHGIPSRILKGIAVGHLDYLEPDLRPTGDIDLLVPGREMPRAVDLLSREGLQRRYPEPYAGYDQELGKGVTVVGPDHIEIDLHRTLALGYFGTRLPVEHLWFPGDTFTVAGQKLVALPRPARFVHAALHLVLSPLPKVIQAWDLIEIEARLTAEQFSQIIVMADRWGCADLVARSVIRTTIWLGDVWSNEGLLSWASTRRTSVAERAWFATYHGKYASSGLRTTAAVAGLRSRRTAARAALRLLNRRLRGVG